MRKPQALLNLMPPPVCENCEYYHATTECKQCKEYFCDECWSSIHFGGKRRKHKFRALYDFYGKWAVVIRYKFRRGGGGGCGGGVTSVVVDGIKARRKAFVC